MYQAWLRVRTAVNGNTEAWHNRGRRCRKPIKAATKGAPMCAQRCYRGLAALAAVWCLVSVSGACFAGADDSANRTVFFVSKLGDNSDGSSWAKAFRSIQAGLNAVPDDRGNHRIIVRPDTYMEANLFPAHRGATRAYNELVGDWDGSLGSGRSGWVVIDSGDVEKGFKSYDWWGPLRANGAYLRPSFRRRALVRRRFRFGRSVKRWRG